MRAENDLNMTQIFGKCFWLGRIAVNWRILNPTADARNEFNTVKMAVEKSNEFETLKLMTKKASVTIETTFWFRMHSWWGKQRKKLAVRILPKIVLCHNNYAQLFARCASLNPTKYQIACLWVMSLLSNSQIQLANIRRRMGRLSEH